MAETKDLQSNEPTGKVHSVAVDVEAVEAFDKSQSSNCGSWRKQLFHKSGEPQKATIHYFDTSDTFLYALFSEDIAEKITIQAWNPFIFGIVCVATCIWYFFAIILELSDNSLTFWVFEWFWFSLFAVYFSLILLSVNRKAFGILIKTFDLWIKVYAAVKIIIASIIYYPLVKSELYSERSYSIILFYRINSVLVVVLFSFVDGFEIEWKKWLLFGVILSSLFSVTAFRMTLDDRPDRYVIFGEGQSLSLVSQIASADRLLSIFLWKQTIKMWWKKGKVAIAIKHHAKIRWDEKPTDGDDDKYPIEIQSGSENV